MTHLTPGERKLRLAMVQRAIEDAQGHVKERRAIAIARIRADALDWIRSRKRDYPLSFERICADFGLNAERARTRLLRRLSQ